MVKDVGELSGELDADPLRRLDVLDEAGIQVPAREAAQDPEGVATLIDTEDEAAELGIAGPRILEVNSL